mmetsp:Transcript_66431/g.158980  ORF Transcript_66431/g.158980 Transcript_66431/m.158980 type:complete len:279 (+) Transcript_66431:78-914(+)
MAAVKKRMRHLEGLAAAREEKLKHATSAANSAPQLNWTDLPEETAKSLSRRSMSTVHRSQYRPNNRFGGWAGCDRKKVISLCNVPEHDALEEESYDSSDDVNSDLHREEGVGQVFGRQHSDAPAAAELSAQLLEAGPSSWVEEEEWEHCDVSSIGDASWLEVEAASIFDETWSLAEDDDKRSVCSDMSFVMVDTQGTETEEPPAVAQAQSWAARLSQSNSPSQPFVQPRRFPAIAVVPAKKKAVPKADNCDDMSLTSDGFGMREAETSRSRRQNKGRR